MSINYTEITSILKLQNWLLFYHLKSFQRDDLILTSTRKSEIEGL